MAETGDFQRKQYAFAAHIRDPDHAPAPEGIEDRRIAIYRELFFNNLNKLLGSTFPVLRKILDEASWRTLVRDFMARHRARTPYFLEIPREFVEFLAEKYPDNVAQPPFLSELAHYEWVELALSISTKVNDLSVVDRDGDLLEGVPMKSALAWVFSYRFPVHRIAKNFMPEEPGEQATCLVIYRKTDDELGFMELNAVAARLLERIDNNDGQRPGRALLLQLAKEIGYPDHAALVKHGQNAMENMREAGILLGVDRRG